MVLVTTNDAVVMAVVLIVLVMAMQEKATRQQGARQQQRRERDWLATHSHDCLRVPSDKPSIQLSAVTSRFIAGTGI